MRAPNAGTMGTVVVAEALSVLEGAYHLTLAQAAAALLQFVRALEVEVEDEEAVLTGLRYHAGNQLDLMATSRPGRRRMAFAC